VTEPVASRPYMPGYGILGPGEGRGLLPWSWAETRLVGSRDYWVATVGPDGSPHVTPVWGVWVQGAGWFSSSRQSRKARNIGACGPVVLTTDDSSEPVVVEGDAVLVTDAATVTGDILYVDGGAHFGRW